MNRWLVTASLYDNAARIWDAATGDLLWQYSRWLPKGVPPGLKRAIALNKPVVVDVATDMYAIAPHPWTPTGRDFHSYQKG